MESLTIRWESAPDDPARTIYFVNGAPAGEGDSGFDRVLEIVRSHPEAKIILKIVRISGFGGESLDSTLPFRERFGELKAAMGEKGFVYEFF